MEEVVALLRDSGPHRVSLDIDVTIADIYTPMMEELNRRNAERGNPTNYTKWDMKKYDWSGVNSSWPEEMCHIYKQMWLEQHETIPLLINTDALHELTRYYKVDIVTTKDGGSEDITVFNTKLWLKRHGLDKIDLKVLGPEENRAHMPYTVYIDDNPGLIPYITNADGKVLFLVSVPQNSEEESDGRKIIRVRDADHAINLLIDSAPRKMKRIVS